MRDVTSFVGTTIAQREVKQLQTRIDALGWQLQTQPAGHGQVKVVSITAPAAPEDEPAQGINDENSSPIQIEPAPAGDPPRSDRELAADYDQPALLITG